MAVAVPYFFITGQGSVFVAKLLPDGKIAFSATIGGERVNTASAIAVDLSELIPLPALALARSSD
jgi:hypothetical protein